MSITSQTDRRHKEFHITCCNDISLTVYLDFIHLGYFLLFLIKSATKHLSDLVCIALGKQQRTVLITNHMGTATSMIELIKITFLCTISYGSRFLQKIVFKSSRRTQYITLNSFLSLTYFQPNVYFAGNG